MEYILEYIAHYGLPVFVMASCIIAFIGTLKVCKVFNKITNDNIKKFIYYTLNVILAFGAVAIYFVLFKIDFSTYFMVSFTQVGATTTLYAIYENFGLRKVVQMFLAWLYNKFKKDPESKFVKNLKTIGLTEDAIKKVQELASVELAKVQANKETK